jgi:hypothetical protein
MRLFYGLAILFSCCALCDGQMSYDDAQKWLASRPKAGTATQSADNSNSPKRAWKAKDGAPKAVIEFAQRLPELRLQSIQLLKDEIKAAVQNRADISNRQVSQTMVSSAHTSGIFSYPAAYADDPAAVKQKQASLQDCDKQINSLKKTMRSLQDDDSWFAPDLSLVSTVLDNLQWKVGGYGYLHVLKVIQVIDDHNLIAEQGDTTFWLSGLDTSTIVDDKDYDYDKPVAVTGTKRYETVLGGTRQVYTVTPIDFAEYLELGNVE